MSSATDHLPPGVHTYDEWHEDLGDVLWFHWPIQEAPWCGPLPPALAARAGPDGTPHDSDWPEDQPGEPYYTHWCRLPPLFSDGPDCWAAPAPLDVRLARLADEILATIDEEARSGAVDLFDQVAAELPQFSDQETTGLIAFLLVGARLRQLQSGDP